MKKILIIIALAIIVGGAGYYEYRSRQSRPVENPAQSEPSDSGDIIADKSLVDRLNSGQTLDCHIITPDFMDFIVLTKNGRIRIDGNTDLFATSTDEVNWTYIVDGDWTYIWNDNKGVKVNRNILAESGRASTTDADKYYWENLATDWQIVGAKIDCKEAKLSDNLFLRPEAVRFTDLTGVLTGSGQALPDLPSDNGIVPDSASDTETGEGGGEIKVEYEKSSE